MQLKTLLDDDRGVSPVIGVILMVAITVILAAVIGTFVLGLGSNVGNQAPSATFNYGYSGSFSDGSANHSVSITDQGGQQLQASNINVTVGSNTVYAGGSLVSPYNVPTSSNNWQNKITAGDTLKVSDGGTSSGKTFGTSQKISVIWQSSSGGSSSVISTSTTPSS